jgi:hypothetical protein
VIIIFKVHLIINNQMQQGTGNARRELGLSENLPFIRPYDDDVGGICGLWWVVEPKLITCCDKKGIIDDLFGVEWEKSPKPSLSPKETNSRPVSKVRR